MATKSSENDPGEYQFNTSTDYFGMEGWLEGSWPDESGGSPGQDEDGGKGEWAITVSRRNMSPGGRTSGT